MPSGSIAFLSGRLSSLGAPVESPLFATYGEGSSFLAVPTKRNSVQQLEASRVGKNQNNANYMDFKQLLAGQLNASLATNGNDSIKSGHQTVPPSLLPSDQQWAALNQLRIHAGAPERTEKGVEKLMQYFAQLCWLEERFPFETSIKAPFSWFEAFYVKRNVDTSCMQYEKAAVIWNLGALYSQLGTIQCLWTLDGLKAAAIFFQKAAGAFVYLRDTLYPRIQVRLDQSSDLSDATLTAAAELMLAQAAECFYLKAEYDNSSSAVTCQIAVQASDYYDIAYKAAKVNNSIGRVRFPKIWSANMEVKKMLLTSIAHFHCPNMMAPDVAVGERQARLLLAKDIANRALDKCVEKDTLLPHELRNTVTAALDKIARACDELDKANFDDFHQTVLQQDQLKPLKRPAQTLVGSVNVIMGSGNGSLVDGIYEGWISDLFDGVVGIMCIHSGASSGLPHPSNLPERSSLISNFTRRMSQPVAPDARYGSNQCLVDSMIGVDQAAQQSFSRRSSKQQQQQQVNVSLSSMNVVKEFMIDMQKMTDAKLVELTTLRDQIESFKQIELSQLLEACSLLNSYPKSSVEQKAKSLLVKYRECSLQSMDQDPRSFVTGIEEKFDKMRQNAYVLILNRSRDASLTQFIEQQKVLEAVWNGKKCDSADYDQFANLKAEVTALSLESEQETFEELFASNQTELDLKWSENKIKAVVPCLDADYLQRKSKVLKILAEYSHKIAVSVDKKKGSSVQRMFDGLSAMIALVDAAQKIYDDLESELNFVKEYQSEWGFGDKTKGRALSVADIVKLIHDHVGTEMAENVDLSALTKLAKGQCAKVLSQSDKMVKNAHKFASNYNQFAYTIQLDASFACEMVKEIQVVESESDSMVSIFLEQLAKWSLWYQKWCQIKEKAVLFKQHLDQCSSNMPSVHQFANRQAGLERVIDQQIALENESIEHSYKVANTVLNDVLQSPITQTKRQLPKDQSKRASMLRNISVTAQALQKMAQVVKSHVQNTANPNGDQVDLSSLRQQLNDQMKKLQLEHSRITQGGNLPVQAQDPSAVNVVESRRKSEMPPRRYKSLDSNLVQKRPSFAADNVISNRQTSPVRDSSQRPQQRHADIPHFAQSNRRSSVNRKVPAYELLSDVQSKQTCMYDEESVREFQAKGPVEDQFYGSESLKRGSIDPVGTGHINRVAGGLTRATPDQDQFRRFSNYSQNVEDQVQRDYQLRSQKHKKQVNGGSKVEDGSKQKGRHHHKVLKDGIDNVSHYFAWHNGGVSSSKSNEDFHNFARRGSLGGEL
ncbi:hypothetical protein MIR68_000804 [Amoeboaphelidium protococcarum]|nr:hypothetical protein MIR68_000804 [Amoeboaphelidium protococcarum]